MRSGSVLSILNAGNCYASLRSLSVTLESEVCRLLECRSLHLVAWDEVWKLYSGGKWCSILPLTDEYCDCCGTSSGARESRVKQASCCFLSRIHRELVHWKYVFFRPSRQHELCKLLRVQATVAARRAPTERSGSAGSKLDHGEYLLVVKLGPARLDRPRSAGAAGPSGLLIVRTAEAVDATMAPTTLAKRAHTVARRLIDNVSNAYHTALHNKRMTRLLAENTFILEFTRITSHFAYTHVTEVFARIDHALRAFRALRLSAILATDDVNRELVQVWHNKDPECLECKPIPIDCEPMSRCLFHGEAQIVSLSQVRSMNRQTPRRNQRRLFGDASERNMSPHRPTPMSGLLVPPTGFSEFGPVPSTPTVASDDACVSPPVSPSLSPGILSKVHGFTLKTPNEKQGCRLLAPLIGPNGAAKVVMVIDRKANFPLADDPSVSSTTDYDAFMSPSLFRVLQEMVRTLGTTTRLHSVISDYVMTSLITQNQKRRESAPSHCIIEFVYGVIPTKRDEVLSSLTKQGSQTGLGVGTDSDLDVAVSPPPQAEPELTLDSVAARPAARAFRRVDRTFAPTVTGKTRRASAPIFSPSQLMEYSPSVGSSQSAETPNLAMWQSRCVDYFSLTHDQFFEFFEHCLAEYNAGSYAGASSAALSGATPFTDRRAERQRRRGFMDYVLGAYRASNPYHNKYHAMQVFHVTWQILSMLGETLRRDDRPVVTAQSVDLAYASSCSVLEPDHLRRHQLRRGAARVVGSLSSGGVPAVFDELGYALLLASILHDIDHVGVTNNYLIATSHPLSIIYNDRAVLEQHHCAFTFSTLAKRPQIDLIRSRQTRKLIIDMVLATDMAMHTALMGSLTQLTTNCIEGFSDDEWTRFGQIILHAADLSNQMTPFPFFVRWAGLCIQEFNTQVDLEIENNVPITSFMNCRTDSSRIEMELGFLEFVVLPLWQPLTLLEPKLMGWLETGRANSEFWRRCLKELAADGQDNLDQDDSQGGGDGDDELTAVVSEAELTAVPSYNAVNAPSRSAEAAEEFIQLWRETGKSLFELEFERH